MASNAATIAMTTPAAAATGALPMGPLLRIALATAAIFCSMAIIPPTVDEVVRQRFGEENHLVGQFYLVHSLPQLFLLGLLVGVWSDRLRRRVPLAVLGTIGTGITTIFIPHIAGFGSLLSLRFLDGIFGIAALGMLMTRALDLAPALGRGRAMALYLASIPVGYLTGSFFVAAFGTGRLPEVFLAAGGFVIFAGVLLAFDLRTPEQLHHHSPRVGAIVKALTQARGLWFPLLFGFVDKFTFGLITLLSALAVTDMYGLSPIVWGGSALGLLWVAYLLASPLSGWLANTLGSWRAVGIGSFAYGVTLLLLVAFPNPAVFVLMLTLAGAFIALQIVPTYTLLGEIAGEAERATAMGAFNFVGSLGMLTGLAVAGFASSTLGYFLTFAIGGTLEIASALIAFAAVRRMESAKSANQQPIDDSEN